MGSHRIPARSARSGCFESTFTSHVCDPYRGWAEEYRVLTRTQGRARPPLVLADRAVDAFVKGTISARPVGTLLQIDSDTLLEWHATAQPAKEASRTETADERAVFAP